MTSIEPRDAARTRGPVAAARAAPSVDVASSSGPTSPPQDEAVWEVRLRSRLGQGAQAFELDVAFASTAPRVVVRGPSGAGKSRTLAVVAGVARADDARIRIGGRTLDDRAAGVRVPARRRRLGVVFQHDALMPHLSVRDNVALGRRLGRWAGFGPLREADRAAVETWIERLGLGRVASLHPHQLSGGQRQRTALARALAADPAALLLDEPFAALERPLRERLRDELLALQRRLGLPMLLVSHDDGDADALDAHVVTIEGGRVRPLA